MKICLIGDFSGTPDEGMKNLSKTIAGLLSLKHEVLKLSTRDVRKIDVIRRLKNFSPQIVHYLHGPTVRSFFLLRVLRMILGCKTVASATRPYFSKCSRWLIMFLKSDLVLTQSEKFERFFKSQGCNVVFLPNGVDCNRFYPIDEQNRSRIRKELGLPEDKKILLHVGHIKENRQLNIFEKLQQINGFQVVIVGGTTQKSNEKLKYRLENAGIMVFHRYFDDVSIVYKAADMYVFPIRDTDDDMPDAYNQVGAIDLPLSVLEAMACNMPVITTRFGALPRLFEPGNGFFYSKDDDETIHLIKSIPNILDCNTRKKVLPYHWENIVARIESEYQRL